MWRFATQCVALYLPHSVWHCICHIVCGRVFATYTLRAPGSYCKLPGRIKLKFDGWFLSVILKRIKFYQFLFQRGGGVWAFHTMSKFWTLVQLRQIFLPRLCNCVRYSSHACAIQIYNVRYSSQYLSFKGWLSSQANRPVSFSYLRQTVDQQRNTEIISSWATTTMHFNSANRLGRCAESQGRARGVACRFFLFLPFVSVFRRGGGLCLKMVYSGINAQNVTKKKVAILVRETPL